MIGSELRKQALIGLLLGIAVIVINRLFPSFSIGFPVLPNATVAEKFFIIVFLIPIGEELAFRMVLPGILDIASNNILKIVKLPLLIKGIIIGLIFAIFHFTAYGASIEAASASFILASLFGFSMSLLAEYLDPDSTFPLQVSTTIIHIIFNAWLVSNLFIVVGV